MTKLWVPSPQASDVLRRDTDGGVVSDNDDRTATERSYYVLYGKDDKEGTLRFKLADDGLIVDAFDSKGNLIDTCGVEPHEFVQIFMLDLESM